MKNTDNASTRRLGYVKVTQSHEIVSALIRNRSMILEVSEDAETLYHSIFSRQGDFVLPKYEKKGKLLEKADFPFFVAVEKGHMNCECGRELNGFDIMTGSLKKHGDGYLQYLEDAANGWLLVHVHGGHPVECTNSGNSVAPGEDYECNPYKYWGTGG